MIKLVKHLNGTKGKEVKKAPAPVETARPESELGLVDEE